MDDRTIYIVAGIILGTFIVGIVAGMGILARIVLNAWETRKQND